MLDRRASDHHTRGGVAQGGAGVCVSGEQGGERCAHCAVSDREIWGKAAYDETYAAQAPRSSTRDRHALAGFGAIALGGLFVLFGLVPPAANATQPNPEHKVTLCHATDSYSHPVRPHHR